MTVKKRLALVGATVLMALSSFSMLNASADSMLVEDLAMFDWGVSYAQMVNVTKATRYMETCIEVYSDANGNLVANIANNNTGGKNASCTAYNYTYSSYGYNFRCWGSIYNGSVPATGIAWFTGKQGVD